MSASDFLQDLGLFEGLSREQLDRIAAVCVERRCAPGEIIFTEYARGDDMFFIKDGMLLVADQHAEPGDRAAPGGQRTAHHRPPDGRAICRRAGPGGRCRALSDCSQRGELGAAVDQPRDIERLGEDDPHLGYIFMRNIAQELSFKLRNTGLVMRGGLWSNESHEPPADSGFGFEHPTEVDY